MIFEKMVRMDQKNFLKEIQNPETYGKDVEKVKLIQTHISFVVLTGNYAYKIKKPVDFGFLDFSTLEKRKYFCNQEIKLNKRLCPEIYLEVVSITKKDDGLEINGSGEVVDYAVKMKEFSQNKIMTNLLNESEISEDTIDKIVDDLVNFYKKEESTDEIKKFGKIKTIKQNTDENFKQTESVIDVTIDKEKFDFIKNITNEFLGEEKHIFEKRINTNYIKDCHGDLHTGNIVIKNDKICIFDCIEFNKRFRYSDVASDICFLAMDLDFQGHPYLGSYLIKKYVEKSKDTEIYEVLNFYKSYRAYVRGKVTGFKLSDSNIDKKEKKDIIKIAKKYFDLAYYYTCLVSNQIKKEKPILFITSGLTGTGKTTVANKISVDYNARKISTDEVRKEMRGIDKYETHHEPYNTGMYSPEKMRETYEHVIKKGKKYLSKNRNVVLDATFKSKDLRKKARRIAEEETSNFLILNTVLPEEIVKNYLKKRVEKKSISDGRWEIYEKQKESFDKLISDEKYVEVDISKKSFDYQLKVFNSIFKSVIEG